MSPLVTATLILLFQIFEKAWDDIWVAIVMGNSGTVSFIMLKKLSHSVRVCTLIFIEGGIKSLYNPLRPKNRTEVKMIMKRRNALKIRIALFLTLSFFSGSASAGICLCGSACPHALQSVEKTNKYFSLHMRCPYNLCESCGLEKGQTFRAKSTVFHKLHTKIQITALIPCELVDDPSKIAVVKIYTSVNVYKTLPTLPIYLQQLSLLC